MVKGQADMHHAPYANGVVIELSEPDKKGYFRIVFSKKPLKSKDQFALR